MFDRIGAILKKEFLQVFRDPRMKMVIFVAPLIQVFIFGYAATMDITHVPIAVYDIDNTKESRALIHDFSYSGYFDIKRYIKEEPQVNKLIDKSRVLAVLKFNAGFSRDAIVRYLESKGIQTRMLFAGNCELFPDSFSAGRILCGRSEN